MDEIVLGEELEFRQEQIKRMLEEFYEEGSLDSLLEAGLLLNVLWHHQCATSKWLAHEAAENLGEAWQSLRLK